MTDKKPEPKLGIHPKSVPAAPAQVKVPPPPSTPVMSHSDHLQLAHEKTLAIVQYYRMKSTDIVAAEAFFLKNEHLIVKR